MTTYFGQSNISLSTVNTALGRSSSQSIDLNDGGVRSLLYPQYSTSSGATAGMDGLKGTIVITSNLTGSGYKQFYDTQVMTGTGQQFKLIVMSGVYVQNLQIIAGTYTTSSNFYIINYGYIVGQGGEGGGGYVSGGNLYGYRPGYGGGQALTLSFSSYPNTLQVHNFGYIAGGGGGGGSCAYNGYASGGGGAGGGQGGTFYGCGPCSPYYGGAGATSGGAAGCPGHAVATSIFNGYCCGTPCYTYIIFGMGGGGGLAIPGNGGVGQYRGAAYAPNYTPAQGGGAGGGGSMAGGCNRNYYGGRGGSGNSSAVTFPNHGGYCGPYYIDIYAAGGGGGWAASGATPTTRYGGSGGAGGGPAVSSSISYGMYNYGTLWGSY